jgi:hypothetical protein
MNELAILWEQLAIGNQQFSCASRPMGSNQQSALSPRYLTATDAKIAKGTKIENSFSLASFAFAVNGLGMLTADR